MAMSHDNCDHPRDPKGRAWCRANGGPGSGAVWGSLPDDEPTMVAARKGPAKVVQIVVEPRTRRGRTVVTDGPKQARTRSLKAEHDLADVPHAFGTIIRWSWDHGLDVRTGHTFNDHERTIVIESDHGWLTLIWRASTPFGVHGQSWRPRGTSIAHKLMTVQQGLMAIESGVWE